MKTCEEIYQEMLALFAEKTGFAMDGTADLAVRLYAAALGRKHAARSAAGGNVA